MLRVFTIGAPESAVLGNQEGNPLAQFARQVETKIPVTSVHACRGVSGKLGAAK